MDKAYNNSRQLDTAVRTNWRVCDLMDRVQVEASSLHPENGKQVAEYMRWLAGEMEKFGISSPAVNKAQAGVYRAVAELIEAELGHA